MYAGHRGGREKVAIKVMQVPGDHRERVLKEFSQESLLLSICYTDFVLGFRGAPCCGTPLSVLQCSAVQRVTWQVQLGECTAAHLVHQPCFCWLRCGALVLQRLALCRS